MFDDIVVRLRNWDDGRVFTHYEGCWDSHPGCAILLAADAIEARDAEIERLRAEVNRLTLRSCATCRFGYIDSVGMADCAMFDKVFKPDHYCAKWEVRRGRRYSMG